MGIGADLTLIGKDLIRLLLGPGWDPAGRIFTFFGPGIGIMFIYSTHGWIHLSIGRADRWFRWSMVELIVTGLLFLLGLHWGPAGIAVAWTVSFWILAIPAFWYAGRPIHLNTGSLMGAVWKYLLASALAGCASAVIIRWLPSSYSGAASLRAVPRIAMTSLAFGSLYIGAIILLHGGLAPLSKILNVLQDMVPWIRVSRLFPVLAATTTPD
jgi:PST family polysaccharide transporter